MKTMFITLLLIVASAIASFANTPAVPAPQQAQGNFVLRNVQITFDINPNNPDIQYLNSCTLYIPDGTPDYYITQIPISNYTSFEHIYNSPELLSIDLHLQYPYTDRIRTSVSVSSTEGPIQYYEYAGGLGSFAIRCETQIQEGSKYLIKVHVGY